jgi:DNA segregation ATPase FtsK/SpoIIIE, S-DNA-T family
MAPRTKKTSKEKSLPVSDESKYLQEETIRAIVAVGFFVLGVFFILSALDKGGKVGQLAFYLFHDVLFGIGFYIVPVLFFILCFSFFRTLRKKLVLTHSIGGVLFFISGLALIDITLPGKGGLIGGLISAPLLNLFDTTLSVIVLSALALISLFVIFDAPLRFTFITSLFKKPEASDDSEDDSLEPDLLIANPEQVNLANEKTKKSEVAPALTSPTKKQNETGSEFGINPLSFNGKEFIPPPLSLLELDHGKPGVGDIKANSNIIKRTLQNFGITVEMDEISIGPSITRYALKPAEGVKLSRIVGYQQDLSLALAAHPIRIEAPIPGKSLVVSAPFLHPMIFKVLTNLFWFLSARASLVCRILQISQKLPTSSSLVPPVPENL